MRGDTNPGEIASSSGQRTQSNSSRGSSEQGHKRSSADGEQHGSGSGNSSTGSVGSHGGNTRNSYSQEQTSGRQAGGSRNRSERQDQGGRKPVTCFGCGEQGHIRPNCPNRVRRVKSPGHSSVMQVGGSLAGQPAKNSRIDTGAEKTVVRHDFVPEVAYTGKTCMLDT